MRMIRGTDVVNQHHLAERMLELFRGRRDYVAVPNGKGFKPEAAMLTAERFRVDHLGGKACLGFYNLTPSNEVFCTAADFDNKPSAPDPNWRAKAETVFHFLARNELCPRVEISQSGEAAHVWLFYSEPVPARLVRAFWQFVETQTGVRIVEVYPRQDELDTTKENPLGNLIRYPLWNRSHFVDPENDWAEVDPYEALCGIEGITAEAMHALANEHDQRLQAETKPAVASAPEHSGTVELVLPELVTALIARSTTSTLYKRWRGDSSGMKDNSASAVAQSIAGELVRAFVPEADVKAALLYWCRGRCDKGQREDWLNRTVANALKFQRERAQGPDESGPQELDPATAQCVFDIVAEYPDLRPAVIEGLLREGETMNVIAAPKRGKSWLMLGLAYAVALGQSWLGKFNCAQGDVLILDNELHKQTIAYRFAQLAQHCGGDLQEFGRHVHVDSMRGRLVDILQLGTYFSKIEPGKYKLVILDAFYRFVPEGADENDNAHVARMYNAVDRYADRLGCSFVLVHHTSKGSQTGKAVTDVGAGAGSQSRATDTHLVLRPHEEDDAVVLDAAVRSWKPIEPICLRYQWPVWTTDDWLDPTALKPERPKRAKKKAEGETAGVELAEIGWDTDRFVREFLSDKPINRSALLESAAKAEGLSQRRAEKLLGAAVEMGKAHRWSFGRNRPQLIATVAQPELEGTGRSGVDGADAEHSEESESSE